MASLFPTNLLSIINRPLDDKTVKASIAERDAIPLPHRYRGMIVLVQNTGNIRPRLYWLPTDDLSNWEEMDSVGFVISYFSNQGEFPNIGNINTLYIVKTIGNEAIYRWDNELRKYFIISNNFQNIKIINGGNANG